ncbi:vacuolar import and degradation protein-domain-containing protein [Lactifluus volemus]|nr:vacuolar import and degradation protein-domain-containing protein [Lactifluus volemus]
MPVSPTPLPHLQDHHPQPQIKLCSSCRSPLSQDIDPSHFFPDSDVNDHLMLCRLCKDRTPPQIIQQSAHDLSPYLDLDDELHRPHPHIAHATNPTFVPDGPRLSVSSTPSISSSIRSNSAPAQHSLTPDPSVDITRIRMRSQGHHCLYPGATFQGTQKSGRNSYDVTVSIVDVDFSSSFLCGYLCIRGLTDDWPELTTYFDAEIIGSRYGFLTRGWGADEEGDMVHWARFPAFRHVKNKLKPPHLTMDGYPGAVFMRWKERFLVPDHRVQDINGASFAGFYYVCVDFNSHAQTPPTPARQASSHQTSVVREEPEGPPLQVSMAPKLEPMSTDNTNSHRSSSIGTRSAPGVATMSGFYFHQNSEPYQQLSLQHVPETVSTSFELR